jgi:3-hydroxy-9,10-secoandrosta-1,3,5(10)-triene-9,17-dione monooxygenase reductase component
VDIGAVALRSLVERGLLERSLAPDARYTLSEAGRDAILHVLAAAKSVEATLIDRLGEVEFAALRNLLKQAVLATDPGLPKLWSAPPP